MASSFSRQRNPNMEKALFDWPIVLQYDVKEISRKFFGHEVCLPARSLSQPKPRCVCIRFIHQSNRSISVCLLFLFCSRVFISRSYENRSNPVFLQGSRDNSTERTLTSIGNAKSTRKSFGRKEILNKKTIHNGF